jgi:hypothetical protein
MATHDEISAARLAILTSHETRVSLCAPFLTVLPVTGASVSVLATPAALSTMCATDDFAAYLDELQFDLGEGPCWDALRLREPVVESAFSTHGASRWPLFGNALNGSALRGLYAFPLAVGSLELGAIDLYSTSPVMLSDSELAGARTLAETVSWQVLRRIVTDEEPVEESPYSRREIHQATGMVLAQLDVSAEDAILLLRAHAFSSGRSVREIANDVVERRLIFDAEEQ